MGRPAASAEVQPSGAQRVRAQVEHRSRIGVPGAAGEARGEELVQPAAALLQGQHVAIRSRLDGRVRGNRVRAGLGLAGHREGHGQPGLRLGHDDVGQPVVGVRPEVGMQVQSGADGRDIGVGEGVDRLPGDVAVPGVVGREHRAPADGRAAARRGRARRIRLRRPRGPGAAAARLRPLRAAAAPAGPNAVAIARARRQALVNEPPGSARAPDPARPPLRGLQAPPRHLGTRRPAAVVPRHQHRGVAPGAHPQLRRGPRRRRGRGGQEGQRKKRRGEPRLHRCSASAALKRTSGSTGVGSTPSSTAR